MRFKLRYRILSFVIIMLSLVGGSFALFDSGMPFYYFASSSATNITSQITYTKNANLSAGLLTIETCTHYFAGGILVSSDCGVPTTNYSGITYNYNLVDHINLSLGYLTVNTCWSNYSNGLLDASDCS